MATRKEKISLPATKIIIGGYMAFSVLRCGKVKANEVEKIQQSKLKFGNKRNGLDNGPRM